MSYCYYSDTSSSFPSSTKTSNTKNINIKNIKNNISNNINSNNITNTASATTNNCNTFGAPITFNNMTHQAWTIADLPHRRWRLKYLPDEFRAEDVRDENHPYFTLLKIFDQLRDLAYTTEDVPMLSIIEHKLKIVGKIIDNLIDLPGPYIKGVIDFTALSAYVHTINDLWSKKNQLMLTPVWRSHITSEKFSEYLNTEVYESFLLPTLYHISLILDWWLGDPQFEFWIGIIDLNFDQFETQLEAYVHFYNAVFFPEFKEGRKKENNKDDNKKECIHDTDSSATTPSSMKSDETTDEELNDNDNIFKPLVHTDSSDFEWSDSDF